MSNQAHPRSASPVPAPAAATQTQAKAAAPAVIDHEQLEQLTQQTKPPRRPRSNKPKTEGETAQTGDAEQPKRERRPRGPRPSANYVHSDPADDVRKVFVGNLPFAATEDDLVQHFAAAGEVDRVTLARAPTGRPKGFAFVLFKEPNAVAKAIQQLNGTVVGDREINVENVVPKPAPVQQVQQQKPVQQQQHGEGGEGGEQQRKRRVRKPRSERAPAADGEAAGDQGEERRERRPRNRRAKSGANGDAAASGDDSQRPPRSASQVAALRQQRAERTAARKQALADQGVDLPTTVYVGNVPHSATEQEIQSFFEQHEINVAKVSIVKTRAANRPRGFAFVECKSQADRDAAVDKVAGEEMQGRKLSVSVARQVPKKEGSEAHEGERKEGDVNERAQ